jgi:hypothetical protein
MDPSTALSVLVKFSHGFRALGSDRLGKVRSGYALRIG